MATQPTREAERAGRTPVGTVRVVDPHPLNWLYVTWNTMEEPVRTDESGAIVGACMEDSRWEGATLVVKVRQGIRFQDGEPLTAHSIERAFDEVQKWKAPHPPGTYLNFHPDTTVDVTDDFTVRFNFASPTGSRSRSSEGSTSPRRGFGTRWGSGTRGTAARKDIGEP